MPGYKKKVHNQKKKLLIGSGCKISFEKEKNGLSVQVNK